MLAPQRIASLLSLPASGELAAARNASGWNVACLDPRTLEVKTSAPMPSKVTALAADPSGARLFAATDKGEVYEVSRTAGQPSRCVAGVYEPVGALAVLPGDSVLVAHSGTLDRRSLVSGVPVAKNLTWDRSIGALAVSPDGAQVAVGLDGGDVVLFAAAAPDQQRRVTVGKAVAQVRFLPGGAPRVIAGDGSDSLAIIDAASGAVTREFKVSSDRIRAFAVSDDGKLVATVTDKVAQVWDTGPRALLQTLATRDLPLSAVGLAGHEPAAIVGADLEESTSVPTTELLVFDAASGQPVKPSSTGPIRRCAYALDGRTLLTSGDHLPGDEQPGLVGWDTATGAARFAFRAATSYVLASDFAGRTFFMTEGAADLQQRDLKDGRVLRRFQGTPVMLDVSPDDARIAMLTDAGEARLVDARSAKVLWHSAAGYSSIHLGRDGKLVDLLRVSGPEKDASGTWSRPAAQAEVWEPVKNAVLQRQKLEFYGPENRSAFRPVLLLPGGRPVFGGQATQALAGLPDAEKPHLLREACPLSAASQVTLHRAGDHVFALRMAGTEPGPARAILHWRATSGASPDLWMPDQVSPFGGCELTSLAVSPDGHRLAVGTSMAAVIEIDVDRVWPATAAH